MFQPKDYSYYRMNGSDWDQKNQMNNYLLLLLKEVGGFYLNKKFNSIAGNFFEPKRTECYVYVFFASYTTRYLGIKRLS